MFFAVFSGPKSMALPEVSAGEAVLFEAPRACVAAGPQACDELARRVAKDREAGEGDGRGGWEGAVRELG